MAKIIKDETHAYNDIEKYENPFMTDGIFDIPKANVISKGNDADDSSIVGKSEILTSYALQSVVLLNHISQISKHHIMRDNFLDNILIKYDKAPIKLLESLEEVKEILSPGWPCGYKESLEATFHLKNLYEGSEKIFNGSLDIFVSLRKTYRWWRSLLNTIQFEPSLIKENYFDNEENSMLDDGEMCNTYTTEITYDLAEAANESEPSGNLNSSPNLLETKTETSKRKSFKCSKCNSCWGKKKTTLKKLPEYFLIHSHLDDRCHNCSNCECKMNKRYNLRRQLEKIRLMQYKSFSCPKCNAKKKEKSTVKSRNIFINKVPSKSKRAGRPPKEGLVDLYCPECNYETRSKSLLKKHMKNLHEVIKAFQCTKCDYYASSFYDLKIHDGREHLERAKQFHACADCEYTGATKSLLNSHRKKCHLTVVKPYECTVCHFKTATENALRTHLNKVHWKTNSFPCNECNYTTNRNESLKRHVMYVHKKIKSFTCSECDFTSFTHAHLKRHVDFSHSKVKRFNCDKCDFKAVTSGQVVKHLRIKHKIEKSLAELKQSITTPATENIQEKKTVPVVDQSPVIKSSNSSVALPKYTSEQVGLKFPQPNFTSMKYPNIQPLAMNYMNQDSHPMKYQHPSLLSSLKSSHAGPSMPKYHHSANTDAYNIPLGWPSTGHNLDSSMCQPMPWDCTMGNTNQR